MKATAGLALSGRYAAPAADAAEGLRAWAVQSGVSMTIEDTGDGAAAVEAFYRRAAGEGDLLFGPYGSGPLRAAQRALEGTPTVLWNHGGAAAGRRGTSRVVDVLGPARSYWSGLATALDERGIDLGAVVILHSDSPFGRETAAGAVASLRGAGAAPLRTGTFDESSAREMVRNVARDGARCLIGCGRIEDDLALVAEAAPLALAVGAIVAGISFAHETLGDAIEGSFGPAQWCSSAGSPLPGGLDYPAAQAFAAGQIAMSAYQRGGSAHPDHLWDAARALRCRTILGPFEVDERGHQSAHAPLLVEWVAGPGGPRRRVMWRP